MSVNNIQQTQKNNIKASDNLQSWSGGLAQQQSASNLFNNNQGFNMQNMMMLQILQLVTQILMQLQQSLQQGGGESSPTPTPAPIMVNPVPSPVPSPTPSPAPITANPNPAPTTSAWDTDRGDIMLYGDPEEGRIVPIKLSTFEALPDIDIDASNVYAADHVTDNKSYVMNRDSNFMTVLERNAETGEFTETGKVDLPFHPRTAAKNTALGLNLITGVDKPMFGLVDYTKDELVASGGREDITQGNINNFDGENATGHGIWVSENQFVVPDRENDTITLYQVDKVKDEWVVTEQDKVTAPSSTHVIEPSGDGETFYLALEGEASGNIAAGMAELKLDGDSLTLTRTVHIPNDDIANQGTHHPANHPDGEHVYLGDNSGFIYVVNKETMSVVNTIEAGKGAGHVTFVKDSNLAIVTNHGDSFITVINSETHEKITDIEVAKDSPEFDTFLQAHTGRVSPDGQYFYNFATDSGTFFRVNLETMQLDGEIYTGGTPKQASQPGQLTLGYLGETGEHMDHAH